MRAALTGRTVIGQREHASSRARHPSSSWPRARARAPWSQQDTPRFRSSWVRSASSARRGQGLGGRRVGTVHAHHAASHEGAAA